MHKNMNQTGAEFEDSLENVTACEEFSMEMERYIGKLLPASSSKGCTGIG
jgi:hypothetical protein